METNQDRLLTETEAAKLLGISAGTLRVQRCTGARDGRFPMVPFHKLGRSVRYRLSDVMEIINNPKANTAA